ncbi:hypothetical protein OAN84_05855 [Planktomarina temperata]|nr:hypothetical protein [Planktomarina temperata]
MKMKLSDRDVINYWLSYLAKALLPLIIFPLCSARIEKTQLTAWLVAYTLISLGHSFDASFSLNIARHIAYNKGEQNQDRVIQIQTANYFSAKIYNFLALGVPIIVAAVASLSLLKIYEYHPTDELLLLVAIAAASVAFFFKTQTYTAYLIGLGQIAEVKKTETYAYSLSFLVTFGLSMLPTLPFQILAMTLTLAPCIIWTQQKSLAHLHGYKAKKHQQGEFTSAQIRSSSWRMALGTFAYVFTIQIILVFSPYLLEPDQVFDWVFTFKLLQTGAMFSAIPFYAKIPKLAELYSQQKELDFESLVKKCAKINFVLLVCFAIIIEALARWDYSVLNVNFSQLSHSSIQFLILFVLAERFNGIISQVSIMQNFVKIHLTNSAFAVVCLNLVIYFYFSTNTISLESVLFLSGICTLIPINLYFLRHVAYNSSIKLVTGMYISSSLFTSFIFL